MKLLPMKTLEVTEGQDFTLEAAVRQKLQSLLGGYYEERNSCSRISRLVGLIALDRKTELRISSPKAPTSSLLTWLIYANPSLTKVNFNSLLPRSSELGDPIAVLALVLCRLFLKTVAQHGLTRSYLPKEQNRAEIAGRIDFNKLASTGGLMTQVPCQVWSRLLDTPWNQLIALAIAKISRIPSLRHICAAELESCLTILKGVSAPKDLSFDPNHLPRFALHYRPLCALAKILLDKAGLREGSAHSGLAFLIDLEQLFEQTVNRTFKDAGIYTQPKKNLPYLRDEANASFQMDLFCPDFGGEPLVVEAKYKGEVSASNLHQVITYCLMSRTRRAAFILPAFGTGESSKKAVQTYRIPTAYGEIQIKALKLAVNNQSLEDWANSSKDLMTELATLLTF